MTRILFLDFDGVLHPTPYELLEDTESAPRAPGTRPRVRPVPKHELPDVPPFGWLPILERILEPFEDVRLVVHSSWRQTCSHKELGELLDTLEPRFLGATRGPDRLLSILLWTKDNQATDWRILDDFTPAFGDPPPPELIACPPTRGISDAEVQAKLLAWLHQT